MYGYGSMVKESLCKIVDLGLLRGGRDWRMAEQGPPFDHARCQICLLTEGLLGKKCLRCVMGCVGIRVGFFRFEGL